jgi:hypothetical protein
MPRTQSTRNDDEAPATKLDRVDCLLDRLIFFGYYDGFKTRGNFGFKVTADKPIGSVYHRRAYPILESLGHNTFRGKALKMAKLGKHFLQLEIEPRQDLRPTPDDLEALEAVVAKLDKSDKRPPLEKLADVADPVGRFVFSQYWMGIVTDGEQGFSLKYGPGGSVNHKRSFTMLTRMEDTDFRYIGKRMCELAKEFVDNEIWPPDGDYDLDESDLPAIRNIRSAAIDAGFGP